MPSMSPTRRAFLHGVAALPLASTSAALAQSARSSSFAIHAERICPVGSLSTQPFHIRANAAWESRSRPRSSNRRFAHVGSVLRPRRSSRSRVTR